MVNSSKLTVLERKSSVEKGNGAQLQRRSTRKAPIAACLAAGFVLLWCLSWSSLPGAPATGSALTLAAKNDYYKLLGVDRTSTDDEIKRAYRKASLKWHPDKNPDQQKDAELMFKEIAQAYNVLLDPNKRRAYDQFGTQGLSDPGMQFSGPAVDPFEIFNQFFGNKDPFEQFFMGKDPFGDRNRTFDKGSCDSTAQKENFHFAKREAQEKVESAKKLEKFFDQMTGGDQSHQRVMQKLKAMPKHFLNRPGADVTLDCLKEVGTGGEFSEKWRDIRKRVKKAKKKSKEQASTFIQSLEVLSEAGSEAQKALRSALVPVGYYYTERRLHSVRQWELQAGAWATIVRSTIKDVAGKRTIAEVRWTAEAVGWTQGVAAVASFAKELATTTPEKAKMIKIEATSSEQKQRATLEVAAWMDAAAAWEAAAELIEASNSAGGWTTATARVTAEAAKATARAAKHSMETAAEFKRVEALWTATRAAWEGAAGVMYEIEGEVGAKAAEAEVETIRKRSTQERIAKKTQKTDEEKYEEKKERKQKNKLRPGKGGAKYAILTSKEREQLENMPRLQVASPFWSFAREWQLQAGEWARVVRATTKDVAGERAKAELNWTAEAVGWAAVTTYDQKFTGVAAVARAAARLAEGTAEKLEVMAWTVAAAAWEAAAESVEAANVAGGWTVFAAKAATEAAKETAHAAAASIAVAPDFKGVEALWTAIVAAWQAATRGIYAIEAREEAAKLKGSEVEEEGERKRKRNTGQGKKKKNKKMKKKHEKNAEEEGEGRTVAVDEEDKALGEVAPDIISISATALIGFSAGSGVIFTMLCFRSSVCTVNYVQ